MFGASLLIEKSLQKIQQLRNIVEEHQVGQAVRVEIADDSSLRERADDVVPGGEVTGAIIDPNLCRGEQPIRVGSAYSRSAMLHAH